MLSITIWISSGGDDLADHRLDLGEAALRSPRCACRPGSARAGGTGRRRRSGRSPCRAAERCSATARPAPRTRATTVPRMVQRPGEQRARSASWKRSKRWLKRWCTAQIQPPSTMRLVSRLVQVRLRRQQIVHHRRHEGARQEVARQHREHDRQRERREQVLRHPGDEDDRHEDDADAQRRDEGRHGDLLRAVEDRAR